MAEIARYLREPVRADLAEKMVFVGGARQVGKTTFAQTFLGTAASASPAYLNWDNTKTRAALIRGESPPRQPHETAERWLAILERVYLCFRIAPYGAPRIRAVKKEQKLYLTDWSRVPDAGARFENFVACQLLKYCHLVEDTEGYAMEVRYLRDTDRREVDFVVLRDRQPLFAVECKTGERSVSAAARYFRERTPIPRFYQVHLGAADWGDAAGAVRVAPYHVFCSELGLP